MKTSYISLVTALSLVTLTGVSAAVPALPPTGGVAGGKFSSYFLNLKSEPAKVSTSSTTACGNNSIIVGFETSVANTLFTPKCRNLSDILASYTGTENLGIGTGANTTHKLSVAGKIRTTVQTEVTDSEDTLVTKKYVDEQASAGADDTLTVNSVCLNGDCRTGWPAPDELSVAGYKETYFNFDEDIYRPGISTSYKTNDTCNGQKGSAGGGVGIYGAYTCLTHETRGCTDVYLSVTPLGIANATTASYAQRQVTCQGVRLLTKNDATIRTAVGTATITGRDYGGSSEGCAVTFNITDPATGASCTSRKNSPKPSDWDDNLCKQWVETALVNQNLCPGFKGVTGAQWNLSGNSGPLTINYLGL